MRSIFENVIGRGTYDLTGLLKNIDRYHIEGKLSDTDRDELYAQARKAAAPQYDYSAEIEAIWAAIRALQAAVDSGSGETVEWPEYSQPTGAHDAYHKGDKITFGGVRYICAMDNCVWSPLTYPDAWQEYVEPDTSSEEITE